MHTRTKSGGDSALPTGPSPGWTPGRCARERAVFVKRRTPLPTVELLRVNNQPTLTSHTADSMTKSNLV